MITRVARAFGQPPLAVARAPFVETAWGAAQLGTLERLDALARDSEGLQAATRTAIAFHEPRKLEEERRALLTRLHTGPNNARSTPAEARARARALIDRMRRTGVVADFDVPAPLET